MAVNLAGRGGACPFLSQPRETPTWARIVDTADETCSALDLSEALTEVFFPRVRTPCGRSAQVIFFHECGRRVGGVPRSSLKGKETQHDEGEKNTSNPKTKQKPTKQKPEPKTKTPPRARGRFPLI